MKYVLILCSIFLMSCVSNKLNKSYEHSKGKPIKGQIHTAKKMKFYMDQKDYEMAILLFTKEYQLKIRKIQNNKEIFPIWIDAWTLNDAKLKWYISNIKEGSDSFLFEDSVWKINEK